MACYATVLVQFMLELELSGAVPQTPYRGFASGSHWGTSVPETPLLHIYFKARRGGGEWGGGIVPFPPLSPSLPCPLPLPPLEVGPLKSS